MEYKKTTQVPNILFDTHLRSLTLAELKVLLIIIRQTAGWVDPQTGGRKLKDRIVHSQFITRTGLSRRILSYTIQSLIEKRLIVVSDEKGTILTLSNQRKGKYVLFYQTVFEPVQSGTKTNANDALKPVQKSEHNKTNYKRNYQKLRDATVLILELIEDLTAHVKKREDS